MIQGHKKRTLYPDPEGSGYSVLIYISHIYHQSMVTHIAGRTPTFVLSEYVPFAYTIPSDVT